MLEPTPVRTYEAVRESIDAKLGDGIGMPTAEAAAKLEGVEEVVWVLDNLLACVFDFRLHIWDQGFRGAGYDGPSVIAGVAEVARPSHPIVADLLRWTARWVTTRGVPMSSVVPELWVSFATEARRCLIDVAERWSGVVPREEPATWSRVAPSPVAVDVTSLGTTRDDIFRGVLKALWLAGATDDTLDAFFHDYFERDAVEVDVICRFVSLEGDKAALQLLIRPPDLLAANFGLDVLSYPSLLRVDSIERVKGKLGDRHALQLPGPDLLVNMRSALRQDPEIIVFDATLLKDADFKLFVTAVETGHVLLAIGDSPVLAKISEFTGAPIRDAVSL